MIMFIILFLSTLTVSILSIYIDVVGFFYESQNDEYIWVNSIYYSTIIFSYTLLVYFLFKKHLKNADVVDSPYFIGFILTMVSLIVSFYKVDDPLNPAGDAGVFQLVRQAGIALITSVVGIICRFVLSIISATLVEDQERGTVATSSQIPNFLSSNPAQKEQPSRQLATQEDVSRQNNQSLTMEAIVLFLKFLLSPIIFLITLLSRLTGGKPPSAKLLSYYIISILIFSFALNFFQFVNLSEYLSEYMLISWLLGCIFFFPLISNSGSSDG